MDNELKFFASHLYDHDTGEFNGCEYEINLNGKCVTSGRDLMHMLDNIDDCITEEYFKDSN